MADGPTKLSARQSMANVLRRGVYALRFDPDFVAGKKLSKRAVEQREREFEEAGDELQEGFEASPKAKAKQRSGGHYGASGRRLSAAIVAGATSSVAGATAWCRRPEASPTRRATARTTSPRRTSTT